MSKSETDKVREWAKDAVDGRGQRKLPPHFDLHFAGLITCHCACLAYGSYLRGLIAMHEAMETAYNNVCWTPLADAIAAWKEEYEKAQKRIN